MSYDIKISGMIKFQPPIFGPIATTTLGPVQFDGARRSVFGLHAAPSSVASAGAIVSSGQERPTEDEILEHVGALVSFLRGYTDGEPVFTGYLECQGEETGDLWRVYVRNGQAVRVDPKIVWPDEP